MSNVEVRIVMQMSGARGDGQPWPEVGGTLTVSESEARQLCSTANGSPIAIPVVREETRTETGDAPDAGKTESRDAAPATARGKAAAVSADDTPSGTSAKTSK